MMSTSFNDLDPALDAAFPRISPFDPDASPAPEPGPVVDDVPPQPVPPGPDGPPLPDPDGPGDGEVDPADLEVDESFLDDEELLEADAPEPEEITDVEIGVD